MTYKHIVNNYFTHIGAQKDYYLYQILFDQFLYNEYGLKQKYNFIKNTLENIFFSEKTKQEFIDVFCKIQSIYFSFIKLKYIYFRKFKKIFVNKDLYGTELDLYNKYVICVYHNNGNYLFHIRDLKKIIDNCLTNGSDMFPEPLPIKNPYNNTLFNKSTLYNIYFFLKDNTMYQIELFNKLFLENFNLNSFFRSYEYLIRDYMIKNYINDHEPEHLHKLIILMIDEYNKLKFDCRIKINIDFPKEQLINIFKPYLLLYLKSIYSHATVSKYNNYNLVMKKLSAFAKYNPSFGWKKYSLQKKYMFGKKYPIIKRSIYYDDNHIKFVNDDTDLFCKSHTFIEPPTSFNTRIEDLYRRISRIVGNISNFEHNSINAPRFRFDIYSDFPNDEDEDEDEDDTESNHSDSSDSSAGINNNNNTIEFDVSNNIAANQTENRSEDEERDEYERQLDQFFVLMNTTIEILSHNENNDNNNSVATNISPDDNTPDDNNTESNE